MFGNAEEEYALKRQIPFFHKNKVENSEIIPTYDEIKLKNHEIIYNCDICSGGKYDRNLIKAKFQITETPNIVFYHIYR